MIRFLTLCSLFLGFFVCSNVVVGEELDAVTNGVVERLDSTIPLNLVFKDESNRDVSLKDIIDKPTVLSLVYFDCPGICSPLMGGVSDVVHKLDMELGVDYQILTVSFNPDDSTAKAKEVKRNFVAQLNDSHKKHWRYLTGSQQSIDELTDAVGYRYSKNGDDFNHPAVIIVISPNGKITRYLYGVRYLPFDLKMALVESQKGLSRPTANKILSFCFSYDERSRKYTLQLTKMFGTFTIASVAKFILVLLVRYRRKEESNIDEE